MKTIILSVLFVFTCSLAQAQYTRPYVPRPTYKPQPPKPDKACLDFFTDRLSSYVRSTSDRNRLCTSPIVKGAIRSKADQDEYVNCISTVWTSRQYYRDVFIFCTATANKEIVKNPKFQTCVDYYKSKGVGIDLPALCVTEEKINLINDQEYLKCADELIGETKFKLDSYQRCQDPELRKLVASSAYGSCKSMLAKSALTKTEVNEYCQDVKVLKAMNDPASKSCMEVYGHVASDFPYEKDMLQGCFPAKLGVQTYQDPTFADCLTLRSRLGDEDITKATDKCDSDKERSFLSDTDYLDCMDTGDYYYVDDVPKLYKSCRDDGDRTQILKAEFSTCMGKTGDYTYDANLNFDICLKSKMSDAELKSASFQVCMDGEVNYRRDIEEAFSECKSSKFLAKIQAPEFKQCMNSMIGNYKLHRLEAYQSCIGYNDYYDRSQTQGFLDCRQKVERFKSVKDDAIYLCLNKKLEFMVVGSDLDQCMAAGYTNSTLQNFLFCTEKNFNSVRVGSGKDCFQNSMESLYGDYVQLAKADDESWIKSSVTYGKNEDDLIKTKLIPSRREDLNLPRYLKGIVWDCSLSKEMDKETKDPQYALAFPPYWWTPKTTSNNLTAPAGISVINSIQVHTDQMKKKYQLGGFSGIAYDPTFEEIYIVTDGTMQYSGNYVLRAGLSEKAKKQYTISEFEVIEIHQANKYDFEGIALDANGNFILSIDREIPTNRSYFPAFDLNGDFTYALKVPQKYYSKGVTVSNNPNKTTTSEGGIAFNRGFESITASLDKQFVYTATEQSIPLDHVTDSKKRASVGELVRINRYDLSADTIEEYFYPVEDDKDNGLVELIDLGDKVLLTLERKYDDKENKTTIKLYKTTLAGGTVNHIDSLKTYVNKAADPNTGFDPIKEVNDLTAQKTLLLDFDAIRDQLPGGFKKIDNIEGMTLGPVLPNGHQVIIFVSDNNFNSQQLTQIIFLEVDSALLW